MGCTGQLSARVWLLIFKSERLGSSPCLPSRKLREVVNFWSSLRESATNNQYATLVSAEKKQPNCHRVGTRWVMVCIVQSLSFCWLAGRRHKTNITAENIRDYRNVCYSYRYFFIMLCYKCEIIIYVERYTVLSYIILIQKYDSSNSNQYNKTF